MHAWARAFTICGDCTLSNLIYNTTNHYKCSFVTVLIQTVRDSTA